MFHYLLLALSYILTTKTYRQTKALLKSKFPTSYKSIIPKPSLQPVRIYAQNQPIHPLAYLKQVRSYNQQNRLFATRNFTTSPKITGFRPRHDRSKFPVSRTSKTISAGGAVPFASSLRPNLTGGALPRSAGGYGLSGSGVRHFSHTSGAQTQVVQNVSAGIRAFCIGGGKARFDGVDPVTGQKKYKSVTTTEKDNVYNAWESSFPKSTRGTNLEFRLSPTITALAPSFLSLSSSSHPPAAKITFLNDIVLDNLAKDFGRILRDLSIILADLRGLATIGEFPITLVPSSTGSILRVRFEGCDADLVSRLCDELGIRRGMIVEDAAWSEAKDIRPTLSLPSMRSAHRRHTSTRSEYDSHSDDGKEYFQTKVPSEPK